MLYKRADSPLQVLEWNLSPSGSIEVVTAGDAAGPLRLELADTRRNRVDAALESDGTRPVNLLRARDAAPVWRPLSNARGAETGADFRPQWRLAGEPTGYIKLVGSGEDTAGMELLDPLTNRFTPLAPLELYTFALRAAAHRCEGMLRLALMDDKLGVLQTRTLPFDRTRHGGTDSALYWDLRAEFVAPPRTAWLSVVIEKRGIRVQPASGADAAPEAASEIEQFIFFADPVLVPGRLDEERRALRLASGQLEQVRAGNGFAAYAAHAAVPPAMLAAPPITATLRDARNKALATAVLKPAGAQPMEIRHLLVADGAVSLAGRLADGAPMPQLALFVDGIEGGMLAVTFDGADFLAQGEIPEKFIDGRRHTVDLRVLPEVQVVAGRSLILAVPQTGGLWRRRIDDVKIAYNRLDNEAALMRKELAGARALAGASYGVNEKVARLAPLIHALSADFNILAGSPGEAGPPGPTPKEALLNASDFFDAQWYVRTYLRGVSGVLPVRHYLEKGHAEGLAPHPLFHAGWYRDRFMTGAAAREELPFLHFIRTGAARGFVPHPLFDLDWFSRRYDQNGLKRAMMFFAKNGLELQLDPHPLFDSRWYNSVYPQAVGSRMSAVHHYVSEGAAKGFFPNPLFDPAFYAGQAGPSVAPGGTNPLAHFIERGSDKGLDPNPFFSTAWYRANNPDVAGNWIPLAHYLHVGGAEGRDPGPDFNAADYLVKHPDLDPAAETPLAHFLRLEGKLPEAYGPEVLLARGPEALADAADAPPALAAPPVAARERGSEPPLVNWVIGPENNIEWAYGNNAKRFAARLPGWEHEISGRREADIVLFFDVLVADRFPARGARRIVRVGGARPLDRLFGEEAGPMRRGLEGFDAVIALSPSLQRRVSAAHPNAVFIPNGLDLGRWSPESLLRGERPFTAGFAASAASAAERDVKGVDLAEEAARLADVPLRRVHKGEGQVRHDRMIEDFYSGIDVLVHPVAPGREGCSNVIMEAVSLGIPVITTADSGFHGETMENGTEAFLCSRDAAGIAAVLKRLRDDPALAGGIGRNARAFALRHHDIADVAAQYEAVFRRALAHGGSRRQSVAFLPFWKPAEKFASSRLRAEMPAELLGTLPAPVDVVGEDLGRAKVAVVVQSAEAPLMERLEASPGTFVVYDVCDRYFENPKLFKMPSGDVDSLERFNELMARANAVIAPTAELKADLASRFPQKPVFFVPELIDYSRGFRDAAPVAPKRVLWFGSPQRGNFESARWLLDALRDKHGYALRIVSKRSHFSGMPDYAGVAVDWAADTFLSELAAASLSVVSHSDEEQTKSPNRFVSAVAHGVPAVVSNSRPAAALLQAAGCGWAAVSGEAELEEAVRRLEDPDERRLYLRRVQAVIEREHGDSTVRESYLKLLLDRTYDPARTSPRRVAFVSHNLNFGEGAPKSLFEVATGLHRSGGVEAFVYCAARGELGAAYEAAGVSVSTLSAETIPPIRLLNRSFDAVRRDFKAFLERNRIEYVVANTIKAAPFADFAAEAGVPASIVIRESYGKENRFDYFLPPAWKAAERGLLSARSVVFVSSHTAALWADQPMTPNVRVIPNGVSSDPFAAALASSKAEARARLGLEKADLVAICVGTVNERKGQVELLDWYLTLPPALREWLTILFVGATEGPGLERFRAIYDKLPHGEQERLVTVPTTPEIGPYYRASDLFLMNSTQESYPRSTMEALLFGLPIVSTPVFGVLEQVSEGENGFTYSFKDMEAWHDRITRLVTDASLRERMAAAAARSFWKLTTHAEMLHDYRCIVSRTAS